MTRILSYVLLFVVLFFHNSASAAKIKRHCRAYYYGMVKSITFNKDGAERTENIPLGSITLYFPDNRLSAEASCGRLVPNRCRKRARNKLLNCARAHANSPNQLPQACRPNLVKNYPGPDLLSMAYPKACGDLTSRDGINISAFLSRPYTLEMEVGVFVGGDISCGYGKKVQVVAKIGVPDQAEGKKFKDYRVERLKDFSVTCP